MNSASQQVFSFSISKNDSAAVVFFSGILQVNNLTELEIFHQEILKNESLKVLLMDFSQLKNITMDAIPNFVNFQQAVRSRKIEMRICSMQEDLKAKLSKLGVIRHAETSASVKSAIQAISQDPSRKAS